MNAEALAEKLRREPFTPLRLHLPDRRTVDVDNPDVAVISNMGVYVFKIKQKGSAIADHTEYVSLRHIVSIEELEIAGSR